MNAAQREGVLLLWRRLQIRRSRALAQSKAEVHLSTFGISGFGRLTLVGVCQQRVDQSRFGRQPRLLKAVIRLERNKAGRRCRFDRPVADIAARIDPQLQTTRCNSRSTSL